MSIIRYLLDENVDPIFRTQCIYFNEFGVGMAKNDILILLGRNGKKEAILNASHITAKSLAKALNEAVSKF